MNPVSLAIERGIAVVTIDNPPVNAASQAVRAGLVDAVRRIDGDDAARVAVLICAGRTFVAGADIREFDQPPVGPLLPEVVARIETATTPWIAAIHGTALGGGLEIALGCHYRIADPKARLGFPEVNLGLIPGAGGTVRLARLIQPGDAARMIASGKPIAATRAVELGLVDRLAGDDLRDAALGFAAEMQGANRPSPLSGRAPLACLDASQWQAIRTATEERARGRIAPVEAVDAVREATELAGDAALAGERERFVRLRQSPQSKAMRYVFFAERMVSKPPEIAGIAARPLGHIGVVGGGTMGAGISAAVLLSGRPVTMIERDRGLLAKGLAATRAHLGASLQRGLIDTAGHERILAGLSGSTDHRALADCDLVIEAVFEDLDVKLAVFGELDRVTKSLAVLATNTSYLDVGRIARAVRDPSRVIGLHFFSPAHIMKLLEIVRPETAAPDVLATGFALARHLRKIAVPAGVCDGFIANRIMNAYRRTCDTMLEEGALPRDIDDAMTRFGFAMGLYAVQDLAGLDIAWAMRKRQAESRGPDAPYVAIADRLCELGRFGRKAGAGWYLYPPDSPKGAVDPVVEQIIREESARKGIERRPITGDEIMQRIVQTMQDEGRRILAEGIAASAEAIDVVMVNGFGFPRWRGGPMFMGDPIALC